MKTRLNEPERAHACSCSSVGSSVNNITVYAVDIGPVLDDGSV